jgi:F-type H+-transporting ATPase subunit c
MRSKLLFLTFAILLLAASPVFAQEGAGGGVGAGELTFVGAAVGMAIASGLCGTGQGRAVAAAAEAVARNPGARAGIQTLLVLGLAFIESLAIFTLLIIFVQYPG